MEGASVLGHRARRKSDVSRATILGCTALVVIYVAASILPYGYLTREELMALGSPSMPYIFERVVGPWGGAFISGGLIISIFGAWLSYTILASEAMHGMARMKLLPSAFDRLNTYSAPTACLFTTGVMIQLLSIVMLFSERPISSPTRCAPRRSRSAGRSPPRTWPRRGSRRSAGRGI